MRVAFYGNGGSGNHGCEAIVRGTVELLGCETNTFFIQSEVEAEDKRYGLEQLATIMAAKSERKHDLNFLAAYTKLKLTGNYIDLDGLYYEQGIKRMSQRAEIALSVGGDNYCYNGTEIYAWLNRAYRKNGMKTVLWGCSIEPEVVAQKKVAEDLRNYDLVVARESITYTAIKAVQKNILQAPDPAFFMKPERCEVDARLQSANVIGINASPHILACESTLGMAYENYKQLVQYILRNTDAVVALIPHVVWASNDDRKVLHRLYEDFNCNSRLVLVEDHTAPELKHIISKCSFFVGARTHATIAAYSSGVPTLVVGYSVKARGIARDLFGTENGYVLPVQKLSDPQQLTAAFRQLYEKKTKIHEHLHMFLPEYLASAETACTMLKGL